MSLLKIHIVSHMTERLDDEEPDIVVQHLFVSGADASHIPILPHTSLFTPFRVPQ